MLNVFIDPNDSLSAFAVIMIGGTLQPLAIILNIGSLLYFVIMIYNDSLLSLVSMDRVSSLPNTAVIHRHGLLR